MTAEYITDSARQTQSLGKRLAQEILKGKQDKSAHEPGVPAEAQRAKAGGAFVVALTGELGGGKTTFLQGFAQGLGIKEKILSPTFVLMKRFHVSSFRFHAFYHIDCYRLKGPKEILEIGFKEAISDPKNIVAIEWAERIKKALPQDILWLRFEFKGENERRIVFSS